MKVASHNTMQKRLCREYKVTPREARILLKVSKYDYNLARTELYKMKISRCAISIENLTKAVEGLTKMCIRLANSFAAACTAFREAFTDTFNEEGAEA